MRNQLFPFEPLSYLRALKWASLRNRHQYPQFMAAPSYDDTSAAGLRKCVEDFINLTGGVAARSLHGTDATFLRRRLVIEYDPHQSLQPDHKSVQQRHAEQYGMIYYRATSFADFYRWFNTTLAKSILNNQPFPTKR